MKTIVMLAVVCLMSFGSSEGWSSTPASSTSNTSKKLLTGDNSELRTKIWKVMKAKESRINRCKDRYLKVNSNQDARLEASFGINSKGEVIEPKVSSSLRRNAYIHSCMLSVIRSWRFPAHGSIKIEMRFSVRVKKGEKFTFKPLKSNKTKKPSNSRRR